jgi:hypothetical protein
MNRTSTKTYDYIEVSSTPLAMALMHLMAMKQEVVNADPMDGNGWVFKVETLRADFVRSLLASVPS